MLIHIKKEYKISGNFIKDNPNEKGEIKVPIGSETEIVITLFSNDQEKRERKMEAQYQIDISDSFFEYLKSGIYNGVKFDDQ